MERIGAQWMDEGELALWVSVRGGAKKMPEAMRAAGKERKATPLQLAQMLLSAADSNDAGGVKLALSLGASPNARMRAQPRRSAFQVAMHAKSDESALVVLEAGGRAAPTSWSREASDAFDKWVEQGVFPEGKDEGLKEDAMKLMIQMGSSWSAVERAGAICRPGQRKEALLGDLFGSRRIALGVEAALAGVPVECSAWDKLARIVAGGVAGDASAALMSLLARPDLIGAMSASCSKALFEGAVQGEAPELLLALLDAGMRPNKGWTVKRPDGLGGEMPLAWLAASLPGAEIFEWVKRCQPAMDAARASVAMPSIMRLAPISRLIELAELGVSIEGVDKDGLGLAHIWAKTDDEPRDGWATLARKAPAVFAHRAPDGSTGAESMARRLRTDDAKEAFAASLSRIDSREVRSAAGPSAKAAPAPRRRL